MLLAEKGMNESEVAALATVVYAIGMTVLQVLLNGSTGGVAQLIRLYAQAT